MLRRKYVARAALYGAVTLTVAGAMLLRFAASDDLPRSTSTALLEAIMPVYDVQEVHSVHVDARPVSVYAAILTVTPGETALARPFLWVRALPGRLRGARPIDDRVWNKPFLSVPETAILGSVPEREIVVGLIGQFWKLNDGARVTITNRDQFMAFRTPGFAVSTQLSHRCRGQWVASDDDNPRTDDRS